MMFRPTPVVAVSGFPECHAATGSDGLPALASDVATLTGAMRIRWGRSDPWATVEPSTLDLALFDPTGEWLHRIAHGDAIGSGVSVWWDVPDSVPEDDDLPDRRWYIFNGFVTAVDVEATRQRTVDGWRDGWRVEITAADRRVALGNVLVSWANWGAERMIDRAVRLRNISASSGIREFYYEDTYREAPVSPEEVRDETANSLFSALYESFGQQWTYNAHRNVCIRIPRHRSASGLWLYKLRNDGPYVTLAGNGLYDRTGEQTDQDRAYYHPATIDACDVSGGVTLHTDQIDDLNRWEATWKPRPGGNPFTTIFTPEGEATPPPFRTLSFDSWLSDGVHLDPVLGDVAHKAMGEARGPHHPPVRFQTEISGGFHNVAQAMALTQPSEVIRNVTLTGSPWTAALERPPLHAICGGEITYSGGEWDITADLITHRGTQTEGIEPVPWSELSSDLRWGDDGHPHWRFIPGLSWADLRWTNSGQTFTDWS